MGVIQQCQDKVVLFRRRYAMFIVLNIVLNIFNTVKIQILSKLTIDLI